MPRKDINLIPNEIIEEQSSARQQRGVIFFAAIVFLIGVVLSGVAWFLALSQNVKITNTDNQIAERKEQLKALEDVEKQGSKLQLRLDYVQSILSKSVLYSKVMQELADRDQDSIEITQVNLDDNGLLKIVGIASSTPSLQNYVINLVKEPNNLFSDARILEVSVGDGGRVNFSVSVSTDMESILFKFPNGK